MRFPIQGNASGSEIAVQEEDSKREFKFGLSPIKGKDKKSPAELYIQSLNSKASKKTYISHLNWVVKGFAQIQGIDLEDFVSQEELSELYLNFDWTTLEMEHVALIKQLRKETITFYGGKRSTTSPSTVNGVIKAIRGVSKKAVALGLMDYAKLIQIQDVGMDKGSRASTRTLLEEGDIRQLIKTCALDRTARGIRDAAIIAAMLGCGLRRSDVGNIQVQNYKNGRFSVIGKGDKEAIIYAPEWTRKYIEDWIFNQRGEDVHGGLFCRIRSGEILMHEEGLTGEGVAWILQQRVTESQLMLDIKPHDLRHTFAERMSARGERLETIQDALRHSSPVTTREYLRANEKTLEQAASRDHISF